MVTRPSYFLVFLLISISCMVKKSCQAIAGQLIDRHTLQPVHLFASIFSGGFAVSPLRLNSTHARWKMIVVRLSQMITSALLLL